jgi:hypothetical protein
VRAELSKSVMAAASPVNWDQSAIYLFKDSKLANSLIFFIVLIPSFRYVSCGYRMKHTLFLYIIFSISKVKKLGYTKMKKSSRKICANFVEIVSKFFAVCGRM